MNKKSHISIILMLISIIMITSGCSKEQGSVTVDPKTYYVEPTATPYVIDHQYWLKTADEMRAIANNVTAYRVGEEWGFVTSDSTVTYEPTFSDIYICDCSQGRQNQMGRSTIVATPAGGDYKPWVISDETGKMLCFHLNHSERWRKTDDAYTSVIIPYQQDGLWGFKYKDDPTVLVQPQYLQVTNPLLWNHETYAWGQRDSGWEVVWIP